MNLEELLAQSIEDEEKRQEVLDAIKRDRAGLEANKQKVLDDLKKQQERATKMEGTLQSLQSAFGDRTPDDVKAMMDRLENDEMAAPCCRRQDRRDHQEAQGEVGRRAQERRAVMAAAA